MVSRRRLRAAALLRPAEPLTARHEREHKRPATTVLSQGRRPVPLEHRGTRRRRQDVQHPPRQDARRRTPAESPPFDERGGTRFAAHHNAADLRAIWPTWTAGAMVVASPTDSDGLGTELADVLQDRDVTVGPRSMPLAPARPYPKRVPRRWGGPSSAISRRNLSQHEPQEAWPWKPQGIGHMRWRMMAFMHIRIDAVDLPGLTCPAPLTPKSPRTTTSTSPYNVATVRLNSSTRSRATPRPRRGPWSAPRSPRQPAPR